MLSYQHAYHAGGRADVHKHALLSEVLMYLTEKPKPLCYLESHAGRALYDLAGKEAEKTGEAAGGIAAFEHRFAPDHPYRRAIDVARGMFGAAAYPGSPFIANSLLRTDDHLRLAERHPAEFKALKSALPRAKIEQTDGVQWLQRIVPPIPRRGLVLIDPSYELKSDYETMPDLIATLHRKWPVGVILLWYPILTTMEQAPMTHRLRALKIDKTAFSEVRFGPVREGHRAIGSGLFMVNPPWGFGEMERRVQECMTD